MKQGISVVEVLLIVAAVVLVVAFMYPVFRPHPHDGRRATCFNQERQLAVGILAYAQDHHETLPLPSDWIPATGLVSDSKVFDCPISMHEGTPMQPDYGMNARLYDTEAKTGKRVGVSLGAASDLQVIELLADIAGPTATTAAGPRDCPNLFPGSYTLSAFTGPGSTADLRHSGGLVCAFVDGHVASMKPAQMGKSTSKYSLPLKYVPAQVQEHRP